VERSVTASPSDHLDVVIVGAGLSGIGAAVHLQRALPGATYALLEAREASGGTWDLFRYPGVRSDSDMHTLGYRFRPWPGAKAIADGTSILEYVRDTARDHGVEERIRYRSRLVSAEWSSPDARWTLSVEDPTTGAASTLTCGFLLVCAGYYRYDEGYTPAFPGVEAYEGTLVHPQHWPADLDHAGKRVVVIGSGATAVTLVPALAETAASVTMLQRTPTYIASKPSVDRIADALRARLPAAAAYRIARGKNVLLSRFQYRLAQRRPAVVKALVRKGLVAQLPPDYDVATHFTPPYDPWDQRFCLVPDGDLFRSIRSGRADVVTGTIETFTPTGVRLTSGEELEADVVVTATGLQLQALGGVRLTVDGREVDLPSTVAYKGAMFSGVPNLAAVFGYTNASWTLRADLISDWVCRLLQRMRATGADQVVAEWEGELPDRPFLDLTSGYVQRSVASLPRQGEAAPWRFRQDYLRDRRLMGRGPRAFEGLTFSRVPQRVATDA
jgi:cation diffusion facilitator CzcD-associated flavoprotein CzcO